MTESGEAPQENQQGGQWWWRPRVILAIGGGLLGVVVVAVLLIGRASIESDEEQAERQRGPADAAALNVARAEALAFFSLDHRTVEATVDKVLSLATGTFKEEYAENKDQVIAQVKQKKLMATAVIPDGGVAVEFVNGSEAQVLVVVDVTRRVGTEVDQLRNRVRILLEEIDGAWLVAGVNQVG